VVEVQGDRVLVRLDRRSHNPILREACLDRDAPPRSPGWATVRSSSPSPDRLCEVVWPCGNRRSINPLGSIQPPFYQYRQPDITGQGQEEQRPVEGRQCRETESGGKVAVQPDRLAVVVTHDSRVLSFADRIITLEDGRVAQEKHVDRVVTSDQVTPVLRSQT
jgi:hypothetical protein